MEKTLKTTAPSAPAAPGIEAFMDQTMRIMQGMADMVRATNERMTALEKQVRMLEKVTPGQAAALNTAIRERAATVCAEYRMTGMEKQAAAAIRKSVRLATGAHSAREIARCDYKPICDLIGTWDVYRTMKAVKAKEAGK